MPINIGMSGCADPGCCGVQAVGVQAPIVNVGTLDHPIIDILPATAAQEGSMSAADKAKLDAATDAATPLTLAMRAADGTLSGANAVQPQDFVTLSQLNGAALRVGEVDGSPNVFPVSEIRVSNGMLTDLGGGVVSVNIPASWSLRVGEVDGSPNVSPVTEIRVSNGTLTDLGGGIVSIATGASLTSWQLSGNAGTNDAVNFMGTTDDQSVVFKANSIQGFKIQKTAIGITTVPCPIGGSVVNTIHALNNGSVICGGGAAGFPNQIGFASASIIGGGYGNTISDNAVLSVICGGESNSIAAGADHSFIGGGNTNSVAADLVFIGSGISNTASGNYSALVGGQSNSIAVGANNSFMGAGGNNLVSGTYSVIVGGQSNTAGGQHTVIVGGKDNLVGAFRSVVVGGEANEVYDEYAFIGGGISNQIDVGGNRGVIAGGENNRIYSGSARSFIGGGMDNDAGAPYAVVCGGYNNRAAVGGWASVLGGSDNDAFGDYSVALGRRGKTGTNAGVFLFSDSSDFDFTGIIANEFAARATGGVRLITAIDGGGVPTNGMRLNSLGHMRIGSDGAVAASVALQIEVTDGAILLPRLTTAERNALTAQNGMLLYNTTDNEVQAYKAGAWANL